MERKHRGQHGEDCFGCRVQTVTVSPAATPSRRNKVAPKTDDTSNNWERGYVYDRPGMPYLDSNLEPVGTKEWVNKPKLREAKKRLNHERRLANRR